MKRQSTIKSRWTCFVILGILLMWNPIQTQAAEKFPLTQKTRLEAMDREMRCIALQQAGDIPWQDICATSEKSVYMNDDLTDGDDPILDTDVQTLINNYQSTTRPETDIGGYNVVEYEIQKTKKKLLNIFNRENPFTTLRLGTEYFYFDYDEPAHGTTQGNFFGINGAYERRLRTNNHIKNMDDVIHDKHKMNMFGFEGSVAWGNVDINGDRGEIDDISSVIIDTRAYLGYDIPVKNAWLTPFIGVGYRYAHTDEGIRPSPFVWAFERETQYLYVPFGVKLHKDISKQWNFSALIEFDFLVWGQITSHLEDGGHSIVSASDGTPHVLDPLKNEQHEGYGIRGSVRFTRKAKKADFFVEPFFRYWHIDASDTKQYTSSDDGNITWYWDQFHTLPITGIEPENDTTEYGIKAGVQF